MHGIIMLWRFHQFLAPLIQIGTISGHHGIHSSCGQFVAWWPTIWPWADHHIQYPSLAAKCTVYPLYHKLKVILVTRVVIMWTFCTACILEHFLCNLTHISVITHTGKSAPSWPQSLLKLDVFGLAVGLLFGGAANCSNSPTDRRDPLREIGPSKVTVSSMIWCAPFSSHSEYHPCLGKESHLPCSCLSPCSAVAENITSWSARFVLFRSIHWDELQAGSF